MDTVVNVKYKDMSNQKERRPLSIVQFACLKMAVSNSGFVKGARLFITIILQDRRMDRHGQCGGSVKISIFNT